MLFNDRLPRLFSFQHGSLEICYPSDPLFHLNGGDALTVVKTFRLSTGIAHELSFFSSFDDNNVEA